ncbi:ABC transporter permease [Pseudooceanicola sp. CBS1P-1]|uniref:ABC transporter permease subunit n=1 Tax=Pseudooceanicola albus TaxID=2692189 RepID=A0A6L7G454_9RHOB|nr:MULTISPECIES: ABC transporter permease [Pseudooceanicola]MBT9385068.1 ABC transporter permease [Pseudooceanicola endophyticus]MXN18639.1 ABC transporter permease subunit [Pseudooceanicola albus]
MTDKPLSPTARVLRSAPAVGAIVLLLWLILVPLLGISARTLPPLPDVLASGAKIWTDLLHSTVYTLTETFFGFLAGGLIGILSGILFWRSKRAEQMLLPIFVALQTVPIIAFGAIVVIWFGNGMASKVVIALYLTFFPVAVNTARGLDRTDPELIRLLRSFGASEMRIFRTVSLPTALSSIMTGLKLGIQLSLVGALVGEWFGDTTGLGTLLLQSLYFEDTERVWLLILLLGVIGQILFVLLSSIEKRFIWWK